MNETNDAAPPRYPIAEWGIVFTVCALLPWLDLPEPHMDDLGAIGAAVEMAKGGGLENPWLAGQLFPSKYFFIYPPVYSYLLCGWLKVFGVSTLSLLALPALLYAGAAASLRNFFKSFGVELQPILAFGLVALGLLQAGLRADVAGFTLLMFAASLKAGKPFERLLVALLLGMSLLIAPRLLFIAAALYAFVLYRDNTQIGQPFSPRGFFMTVLKRHLGLWIASFGVLTLLFLKLIDFRVEEFWKTFYLHSSVRGTGAPFHMRGFGNLTSVLTIAIPGVVCLVFYKWIKLRGAKAVYSMLMASALVVMFASGSGIWEVFLLGFLPLLALVLVSGQEGSARWEKRQWWILAILAVLFPLNLTNWCVDTYASITGTAKNPEPHLYQVIRKRIEAQKPKTLRVDSGAARYVFDYKLPEGALDFSFSVPFPGQTPDHLSERAVDEIWCVSRFPFRHGRNDIVPDLDGARHLPFEASWSPKVTDAIFVYGGDFGEFGMQTDVATLVPVQWAK